MVENDLISYFKLLDTLPNPVTFNELAFDEDGNAYDKIIYVNQSFLERIGYSTEDIPDDKTWFVTAYPEPPYQSYISTEWFKAVEKAKENNSDLTGFPAKVRCKDGEDRWFNITTQIEHKINEKYRTIVFIETQPPEKVKLDLDKKSLELIEKQRLLQTIIDTVPIRIFWKDLDGHYLGCNRSFLDEFGLKSEADIIGKTDFDMPWHASAEFYREDDLSVTDSGKSKLNYVETLIQDNGKNMVLSTSKVPLKGPSGETIGMLGVFQDITQEYEAKNRVKEHEKLMIIQSRQAAMGEMISMIAHQWKQPLSSISTIVADMRVKHALGKLTFDIVEKRSLDIDGQVLYLSQTITDFSDFFKPDKAKEDILIYEPVDQAISIIEKMLKNSGITIEKDYQGTEIIHTHAKELQQVCINIIKNAADALIPLNLESKNIFIKTYTTKTLATIEIADNGEGIKEEYLTRVFEPYFSTKTEKNGTGLGLYMSQTIIESHLKGSLTCENKNGGALFRLSIPIKSQ